MLFLYKIKDTNDRDCVVYIDDEPAKFECGHYFSSINFYGACWSGTDFAPYNEIKTILTKSEYNLLIKFDKQIKELGYGIKVGDKRYKRGIWLRKDIQPVFDKLKSAENQELFEEVWEEEKEILMNDYAFSENDIDTILEEYPYDYRDRSIVSCVFDDAYDCGYAEAEALDIIPRIRGFNYSRYFDFEKFGEDLCEDECYVELDDGRIVRLSL